MARLTNNQENFCQEIFKGNSQYNAYCTAYPSQVKSSKRDSIDQLASRLMANIKIVSRLKELREPILQELKYGVIDAFNEFNDVRKQAKTLKDISGQNKAIENKAKLFGLYEKDNSQKDTNITVKMPSVKINGEELKIEIGD